MSTSQHLKVLVIGDPTDPAQGLNLPDAQQEAYEVFKLFKGKGINTTVLIGAPEDGTNAGTFHNDEVKIGEIPPADYFDVVRLLLTRQYDIVHYCGHAQFAPESPESAGWVFKGGVLTARDLEGMERPPSLYCSQCLFDCAVFAIARGGLGTSPPPQAEKIIPGWVATLAEEFFRRGISDYIGTAWEVVSIRRKSSPRSSTTTCWTRSL